MSTGVIARRESAALWQSPVTWVLLAAIQLIVGFVFLLHLQSYLQVQADLSQNSGGGPGITGFLLPRLYGATVMINAFALPLVTMQLFAGERRQGSLALLLGAPVATAQIVFGKCLGVAGFLLALVGLTALMPLSLAWFTNLDGGALALAMLGHLLFITAVAALGLYLSTLTRHPALAAGATLGILLALLMLNAWGAALGAPWAGPLTWPTLSSHLSPFLGGLFESAAVIFFVLFVGVFLTFAIRRLDNDRLRR